MTQLTAVDLDVTYTGSGPTVVFVHGDIDDKTALGWAGDCDLQQ